VNALSYSGQWLGNPVTLTLVQGSDIPAIDAGSEAGQLDGFTTDDPATTCLSQEPSLNVWAVSGNPDEFVVITNVQNADCATADFIFTSTGS
jgi:hypothetical protein